MAPKAAPISINIPPELSQFLIDLLKDLVIQLVTAIGEAIAKAIKEYLESRGIGSLLENLGKLNQAVK